MAGKFEYGAYKRLNRSYAQGRARANGYGVANPHPSGTPAYLAFAAGEAAGGRDSTPYSNTPSSGYDQTITVNADDGRELIGTSWIIAPQIAYNATGTTGLDTGDQVIGLSFDNVNLTGTQSNATLYLTCTAYTGSVRIRAQAPPCNQWSNTGYPAAAPSTATSVGTSLAYSPTLIGTESRDVTSLVNSVLNSAGWVSGGRINFYIYAPVLLDGLTLTSGVSGSRLVITP